AAAPAPAASSAAVPRRGESGGRAAMTGATLLWGATFVASRDILHHVGPTELVCARFSAAAGAYALLLAVRRARARGGEGEWRAALAGGVVSGLLNAGGYLFQAVGLLTTSAGSSAFLTCVGSTLAALFAWPLLGQRPSRALLQGLALALGGSALLSTRAGWRIGTGEAWTLLAAVTYALQIVAIARWAPRADPLLLAAIQAAVLALALLPFAGRAPAQLAALDRADAWRFAYLALAGSVVAPLLQILAQRVLPAGRIALLFALEPVFGLLFAITLGGERFAAAWWIGAALILSGVLRVEWPSARSA
ncbi:MAG TPA: DMT family transporter, partial [Candidatus Eisenbacteria bacterium]